ncbi:putative nucleoredoxin 1 [Diplonema papillatum]|nr:putative nucleoredoxin 1 [Diplonema papillatum]
MFSGVKLQKLKTGELVDAETALAGKKVALYFSASWCGDCTPITAKLATLHEMVNEDDQELEVVWVSADESKEDMDSYAKKHGAWLALPYDSPLRSELPKKYGVFGARHKSLYPDVERKSGIPGVVVVNKNGDVLNFDGVSDIEKKHGDAAEGWGKFD